MVAGRYSRRARRRQENVAGRCDRIDFPRIEVGPVPLRRGKLTR